VDKIYYSDERARTWLTGKETFKVSEIEVFKLEKLEPYEKPDYS